jgi:hypothetical protein
MTPTFDVPPAQFIRLDLFPALLIGDNLPNARPGGVLDAKRVIVTDTHVLVFSDSPTGPELTHTWALVDIQGRNTIGWTIETDEGINFKVRRSTGCGCGTRLRGFSPYRGVPFQPIN